MDIVDIIKKIVWLAVAAAIVVYALRFAGKAAGNAGV
jgi:hypothetical protein